MRKGLLIGLLGVAVATASLFPFTRSKAKLVSQDRTSAGRAAKANPLPDFDIRLAGKGEFQDVDLNSAAGKTMAAQGVATSVAAAAVEQFRAAAKAGNNLRAEINEAGAMKNLFIDGGTLSLPRAAAPDAIARDFLNDNASMFRLSGADVAALKLTKEDVDEGITFLSYAQTVGGVKVFDGDVQVAITKNGEVQSVREGFLVLGPTGKLKSGITEGQALVKAFEHAGRSIKGVATSSLRASAGDRAAYANPLNPDYEKVLSELNVMRVGDSARLAWHVYAEVGANEWYELLVDAKDGELLFRHNLYIEAAQGTVYTEDPDAAPRQLVSFVGDTTINTAAGWMGTSTVTTGNNVEAYLDTNADNAPDANNGSGLSNGHASSATQDFTFPFSTAVDPRTQQAAVVTNLFYFNNFMHDFSYGLGFTETAGNFQTNNYGRGGTGNDSVRAEAQDGSGTNNANFATPPEGSRPRMQQYLFTAPTPDRDSSVDSDVVCHEY